MNHLDCLARLFFVQLFVLVVKSAPQQIEQISAPDKIDFDCTIKKCRSEFVNCFGTPACMRILICLGACQDDNPRCAYDCGYFDPPAFLEPFFTCQTLNKCVDVTVHGKCYGKDTDADQSLTTLEPLVGQWWSIKGLNCGDGASEPSYGWGWDNFPCHNDKITKEDDGNYTWLGKYCYDKNNKCGSGSGSDANYLSFDGSLVNVKPGVFKNKFNQPGTKLPQFRRLRVLAFLPPDVALFSGCIMTGSVRINNINVVSTQPSRVLSDQEIEVLSRATDKLGLDFSKMCTIDNSGCK